MSIEINLKRLDHNEDLPLPKQMTTSAAGADLYAANTEDIVLGPLERTIVPTGLIMEIPHGYEVQIRPRSGLAAKHGISLVNTPGTIDADYRGEVGVIMINLSNEPFTVKRGERIAQAVAAPVTDVDYREVNEVSDTERGAGGFGHTGKK